jgi:hypothetical protein
MTHTITPIGFYIDMNGLSHGQIATLLGEELVPRLAEWADRQRGLNGKIDLKLFIQKDMWDNLGDKLRVTIQP